MTKPYSSDGQPHMTLGEFLDLVRDMPRELELFVQTGSGSIREVIHVERKRHNNNTVYSDIVAVHYQ